MDSSAVALARHLKDHPEKAALIKRLHINPVARTQERDATDCDAYNVRRFCNECKDAVEELAIANLYTCRQGPPTPWLPLPRAQPRSASTASRSTHKRGGRRLSMAVPRKQLSGVDYNQMGIIARLPTGDLVIKTTQGAPSGEIDPALPLPLGRRHAPLPARISAGLHG
ncbi:hypothetical protein OC861_001728 [Tilletia horrida]|nr:hypothetical protein OC845_001993 [Tilletia horrida]KAK0568651.1 hypothetical protein OC861_001728 [Tilletia horrida]